MIECGSIGLIFAGERFRGVGTAMTRRGGRVPPCGWSGR